MLRKHLYIPVHGESNEKLTERLNKSTELKYLPKECKEGYMDLIREMARDLVSIFYAVQYTLELKEKRDWGFDMQQVISDREVFERLHEYDLHTIVLQSQPWYFTISDKVDKYREYQRLMQIPKFLIREKWTDR